jgi:choline monooxygenase
MASCHLFDAFDSPLAVARGLPAEAYIGEGFLSAEFATLFRSHWVFAAFAHRVAEPGDVLPVQVAGMPLLLLRDGNGAVRAFHNVCRHRNLKLVAEPGNCGKLIRCPYHSWSYDLCGALRNAPYFGGGMRDLPEGFDSLEAGLLAVDCEVWHDWIFVNLAPDPMPFDEFLAPLRRQLGGVDVREYEPVATLDFGEVECNWKLLMENFIEPYHVQFVHRTTTAQPLEDHYTVIDEHCVGSVVELSEQQVANAKAGTLGVTSHYLTLFPMFIMGTYRPDQMGVYLHEPLAPNRTRQTRVIYTHRDSRYSVAQIRQLESLWRSVHLEDHAMCRRLQQGRHSPLAADGGLLSPRWEGSVRRFQEMVADSVRPALTD